MISRVQSGAVLGIDGYSVEVSGYPVGAVSSVCTAETLPEAHHAKC